MTFVENDVYYNEGKNKKGESKMRNAIGIFNETNGQLIAVFQDISMMVESFKLYKHVYKAHLNRPWNSTDVLKVIGNESENEFLDKKGNIYYIEELKIFETRKEGEELFKHLMNDSTIEEKDYSLICVKFKDFQGTRVVIHGFVKSGDLENGVVYPISVNPIYDSTYVDWNWDENCPLNVYNNTHNSSYYTITESEKEYSIYKQKATKQYGKVFEDFVTNNNL